MSGLSICTLFSGRQSFTLTEVTQGYRGERGGGGRGHSHKDLTEIAKDSPTTVNAAFPLDPTQRPFWEQQQKASSLKNSRTMLCHALMIKCLYLRHLSCKAYKTLRESGCVELPSQHTLRDLHIMSFSALVFCRGRISSWTQPRSSMRMSGSAEIISSVSQRITFFTI